MTEHAEGTDGGQAGRGRRPWGRIAVGLVALSVVGGLVLYLNREHLTLPPEGCTVSTTAGSGTLDLPAASNAATITAVAMSRGLPERAVTIALATAMQESKIHNLEGGDRDSIGLFQQRPSQGWGTADQIKDPVYATNKFLDGLVKVPGYARMPLTDAAQQVQKSGYPQAYAKHETNATLVSSALTGREPAALSCVVHDLAQPAADPSPAPGQQPTDLGERIRREFGKVVTVTPGTPAAKDPRKVLVLTPQATASADSGPGAARQVGWAAAQWTVAHAVELGVGAVAFDGKVWRVDKPADGWKAQTSGATADRVTVTLGAPAKK
ncbi:hypothetical protein ACGFX4_00325 [Kitasatospora sp. NPDC048365]|uniref:hypothetical protein n=1 Tax=Kitasatospora sp. NPDC048365 TaxID=3364050 RepID=UPI003710D964